MTFHHGMSPKDFQGYLNRTGFYKGRIDGIEGPRTKAAAVSYLTFVHSRPAGNAWAEYAAIMASWVRTRLAVNQYVFATLDFYKDRIDGFYGPNTAYAIELYQNWLRTQDLSDIVGDKLAPDAPVAKKTVWPTYKNMTSFYGQPGNLNVITELPYPMRLAWDTSTTVTRTTVNRRCEASFVRCLARTLSHYGHERIRKLGLDLFGGCFNNRSMRGGSRLSTHAVAAAIDLDPTRNQLRWGGDRAVFARPEYVAFFEIWEADGWVSLGRERNFDWMHLQAVQL